jgi:hypothetical protein
MKPAIRALQECPSSFLSGSVAREIGRVDTERLQVMILRTTMSLDSGRCGACCADDGDRTTEETLLDGLAEARHFFARFLRLQAEDVTPTVKLQWTENHASHAADAGRVNQILHRHMVI